jgi:hypothetical protein
LFGFFFLCLFFFWFFLVGGGGVLGVILADFSLNAYPINREQTLLLNIIHTYFTDYKISTHLK